MRNYLAGIWKCRYFWGSLVLLDLRARYRGSFLGAGWSLLNPLAMTAVICTVWHFVFGMDIRSFGASLLAGICFWNFVTAVTTEGCLCFVRGETYIRQYPAPVAIYPLRVVLGGLVHFLVSLSVLLTLSWFFYGFGNLPALSTLIPVLGLLLLFGWALGLLAAFANTYFPDVQHVSTVGLQILFYATPIIYPAQMLRDKGLGWAVDFNPLAAMLQLIRSPILHAELPSLLAIGVSVAFVSLLVAVAILTLVRLRNTVVFQL